MATSSGSTAFYRPPSYREKQGRVSSSLGLEVESLDGLIALLKEEGLPISSFDHLQDSLGVSTGELASVVQIAPRTLRRRREEGRLRPDESERLLRIGRLLDQATEVLGTPERARKWMQTPLPVLGGKAPLGYADTEPGAREVENVLGRIAHGVFS